jgi:GT2 family glycosyltransferase
MAGAELSCVIVAYHRPDQLAPLLQSLADPRIQVIVVNVEDDPRVRALGDAQFIGTSANIGYAAAVNLGMAHVRTGLVCFMNDDVETSAADVLRLAERVRTGGADVAVPLVEDSGGQLDLGSRAPLRLAQRMLLKGMRVPSAPLRVDAAWAVLVATRADLLRATPMPEAYFMYWEDFDWFFQLRHKGAVIELNPAVRIRHAGGLLDVRPAKSRLLARNAVRCVRRTRGRGAALRAWPVVVAWQAKEVIADVAGGRLSAARAHLAGVAAALAAIREASRSRSV